MDSGSRTRGDLLLLCYGRFHVHSLFAGEVRAVQAIPQDEDGPNVAEHGTVKAEGYKHWQKKHMQILPDLEGHLPF